MLLSIRSRGCDDLPFPSSRLTIFSHFVSGGCTYVPTTLYQGRYYPAGESDGGGAGEDLGGRGGYDISIVPGEKYSGVDSGGGRYKARG